MKGRFLVTIGTFDGVHRGHQKLMRWVIRRARSLGLGTRVVLFSSPPRFYFRPDLALPLLTTAAERRRVLKGLGIDRVEVLRFGPRWAKMAHTRFFEDYLVKRWKAGGVLVGRDFAFGRGRKGDLGYLRAACAQRAMAVGVLPLVRVSGRKISSSHIREFLERGDVRHAAKWLGRPHAVSGKVVRGRGLGARIGVPTANIRLPKDILVPRGVYEVRAMARKAVCNVGTRPTVGGSSKVVMEVHIPGFKGNLYGKTLEVQFLRRIRPEKRFSSLEALKRQIRRDIQSVR